MCWKHSLTVLYVCSNILKLYKRFMYNVLSNWISKVVFIVETVLTFLPLIIPE